MALGTACLAEKELLAPLLGGRAFLRVELSKDVELGRGREIQERLELGHEVDLTAALENIDALLRSEDGIAVEVGRPLFELREVLNASEGPLRPEQPLLMHTAQRRRVDAVAELLRPDVADEVGRCVRVPVRVALEAHH